MDKLHCDEIQDCITYADNMLNADACESAQLAQIQLDMIMLRVEILENAVLDLVGLDRFTEYIDKEAWRWTRK